MKNLERRLKKLEALRIDSRRRPDEAQKRAYIIADNKLAEKAYRLGAEFKKYSMNQYW